jgi:hypothetical protein
MPAKGPVSITKQTIYCFIPILNWYAAHHIKKFRKYLLIVIIVELTLGGLHTVLIPEYDSDRMFIGSQETAENSDIDWAELMLRTDHQLGLPLFLMIVIVEFSVTVYFIRRWSHQWNLQFT